ncbi:C50 carotenoid glucosyltransferase CrtX [Conyzicola nivalis]|uniref:Glycosyl transferase family A n=1 Tax=Conyzicola nivalis TaxID=1477021 RepID=A0A916WM26_9MICO|nr:glycosyltransferase family 2 protein [Conyzicola nivalis]GGB11051.1 glycosyl transferase family A [Conyzicola nivalis]
MSVISVVIPVYNDSQMLRRCLAALAAQSRPADEIVVVDNGSTDDSAAVAREHGVRIVVEPQRGIAAASAAGFDAALGDLLVRLDADSVPDPGWLQHIEQRFDADATLDAATATAEFNDTGRFAAWVGRVVYLGGYFRGMQLMLGHPPLFGSNLALRATAWRVMRDGFHRYNATVHDDLDLSFQVRPGMVVLYDAGMRMQISGRPFDSAWLFAIRSWRGVATIALNWPGWIDRRVRFTRVENARTISAPVTRDSAPSLP